MKELSMSARTLSRSRLVACLALGLLLVSSAAVAESVSGTRTVLSTGTTVTNEPIRYPTGAPARINAVEITLAPGQQTGWHTHPVPLFGYILEGELTVDYGALGKRIFRQGEALVEAMNEAHNGRNTGEGPLKILAVFVGAEGVPDTSLAPSPARQ
jgi:quercetin dioxygenase-like cupin family protein